MIQVDAERLAQITNPLVTELRTSLFFANRIFEHSVRKGLKRLDKDHY